MRGFTAAFSTAERATAFMVVRGESEWENRLVARSTLCDLMSDLRRLGIHGFCVDPAENGGGMRFSFDDLQAV